MARVQDERLRGGGVVERREGQRWEAAVTYCNEGMGEYRRWEERREKNVECRMKNEGKNAHDFPPTPTTMSNTPHSHPPTHHHSAHTTHTRS
jgi:hypothetical protein